MIKFNNLKRIIVSLLMFISLSGTAVTLIAPQTVSAASCSQGFLGFPAWYRGLTINDTDCDIVSPDGQNGNPTISNFIWHIVLNVLECVMLLAGYVSVGFILYGGFLFLLSQGSADAMVKARTTILNAVIGLIISLLAVGVVNFIVTGIMS